MANQRGSRAKRKLKVHAESTAGKAWCLGWSTRSTTEVLHLDTEGRLDAEQVEEHWKQVTCNRCRRLVGRPPYEEAA